MINITKKIALQALDCGTQALVIVNAKKPGQTVVYVNTAFETLTGLNASDVIGGRLEELITKGRLPELSGQGLPDGDDVLEQSWRLEAGGDVRLTVRQTPLYERPGRPSFWSLTVVGPVDADAPDDEAALRDALHDARRKLRRLERTDSATGVPNEGAFGEILQRDWAIARREQRRMAVVVFQVDFLEEYRDSLGRHATDSVLRKIAHAITGSLRRAGDFGARIGDDRFAVVLGSADDTQVKDFAERAVKKVSILAIPHPRSAVARNITVSYGAATEVPDWSAACNLLLETAEQRLRDNQPEPAASAASEDAQNPPTRTDMAG